MTSPSEPRARDRQRVARRVLTTGDAVRHLLADGKASHRAFVRDTYLDCDPDEASDRLVASAEFVETIRLLGGSIRDAVILDLGAGSGVASLAFAKAGARRVIAVEPSADVDFGYPAIGRFAVGTVVLPVAGVGEHLPLADESVDVLYLRQVLHHSADLVATMSECARVLRPGGRLFAAREHVVSSALDLRLFQALHPIHRLAGGEHAFSLDQYTSAIERAGLRMTAVLGPCDSLVNTFPVARTDRELRELSWRLPRHALDGRLGTVSGIVSALPGTGLLMKLVLTYRPGRMYTFIAEKGRPTNE
jgi:SAM-dependent methyltransferase